MTVRFALLVTILVTAALMASSWTWAWVPAAIAGIFFCVDAALMGIERRAARAQRLPSSIPVAERRRTVRAEEERVGVRTALTIIIGLAAIALVLSAIAFEWEFIAIGAIGIFAWMGFIGLPYWVAAVEEETELEHQQLTGESRANQ